MEDAFDPDKVKAELHWQLSTAIESPAERGDAIQAFIESARLLAMLDAEALMEARGALPRRPRKPLAWKRKGARWVARRGWEVFQLGGGRWVAQQYGVRLERAGRPRTFARRQGAMQAAQRADREL